MSQENNNNDDAQLLAPPPPPPPTSNNRQTSFFREFYQAGSDPSVLGIMTEIGEDEHDNSTRSILSNGEPQQQRPQDRAIAATTASVDDDVDENNDEEVLPESVVIPPSRPMGRRTSTRALLRTSAARMSSRTLLQSHISRGERPVPPPPAMPGDTTTPTSTESACPGPPERATRQPSWYQDMLEQGVSQEALAEIVGATDLLLEGEGNDGTDTNAGDDGQTPVNDDLVAEQHRYLALIEAKKRVQERLGYDPDERRQNAKPSPVVTETARPCPLPTLKPPRWTPTKDFPYSVPPKEIPIFSERFIRPRMARQPELQKGVVASTAGPGQMLVRCIGCNSNLCVNMQATLVICEKCSVVCPASSTRK